MDGRLLIAAREGNVKDLKKIIKRDPNALFSLTLQKNTVLHITARYGHKGVTREILSRRPTLLCKPNSKGDTALHIAARYGHIGLIQLLTTFELESPVNACGSESNRDREEGDASQRSLESVIAVLDLEAQLLEESQSFIEDEKTDQYTKARIWRMGNVDGNTALHEALRNKHEEVALHLLALDPGLACFVNKASESPLYLAVEIGSVSVLEKILGGPSPYIQGPNGQTLLNATIIAGKIGCFFTLLNWRNGELVKGVDSHGRTALHYAALKGRSDVAYRLLETESSLGYVRDNYGLSPFLVIVSSGNGDYLWVLTAETIHAFCPHSVELLDNSGQNALHLAVINNNTSMLKHMLHFMEVEALINGTNRDGNTPLHLAVKMHSFSKVKILTKARGVDLKARNNAGQTALDICEFNLGVSFKQVSIRRYLLKKGAPHGQPSDDTCQDPTMQGPLNNPNVDLKPMANTLSVVAILLATITFAAAFTMPGGYKSDGSNQGTALVIKTMALKVFLFSDTLSMCCSIMSVFILMKALVADPNFLRKSIGWSLIMLSVAVIGTMVAFVTGVFAVTSEECLWVAIGVCIMGCSVPILICRIQGASLYRTAYSIISKTLNRNEIRMANSFHSKFRQGPISCKIEVP